MFYYQQQRGANEVKKKKKKKKGKKNLSILYVKFEQKSNELFSIFIGHWTMNSDWIYFCFFVCLFVS